MRVQEIEMMKKVIIIGAGPAGITAAYELLKQSGEFEVLILEESDQIGGISRTVKYKGNRMDIGGHRFFSKDDRVMKWWRELFPLQGADSFDDKLLERPKACEEGGPDPEKTDRVMLLRQRISRIYFKKKFFDYPISMKPQTFINMGFGQTCKAGFSYLGACIHKRPEDSLENFYINRFGRVLYSMFFEGYTEKLWGRHPREISADWGSQRVKGLSISGFIKDILGKVFHAKNRQVETSLIEQFWYPKFGPGQLWETAAQEAVAMGATLRTNTKVVRILRKGSRITGVVCRNEQNEEEMITGDIFLSTMPLKDLVLAMDEKAPAEVCKVAAGLPYRDFVTVGLLVEKLNLKNRTKIKTWNERIPDCWIYVQDTGVKLGRIQVFNNWSPYLVEDYQNRMWIGLEYFCKEGDDFWNMTDRECADFAADELVRMGIIGSREEVLDSHRERVQKAYPAYFDTYSEIQQVVDYINTLDNLFCLGRNGQHRYNNMDHSMATAFETVDLILHHKSDKMAIWNVNTEQSYHESKSE